MHELLFTVEIFFNNTWTFASSHNGLNEAINAFRNACLSDYRPVRLTTPTDVEGTYGIAS